MKSGRKRRITIKQDPASYCEDWYSWWKDINPSWREEDGDVLAPVGDGDWSDMYIPGPNGFLTVLGSILGIRDVLKDDMAWGKIVEDVRWTVSQVLAAKETEIRASRCVAGSHRGYSLLRSVYRAKRPHDATDTTNVKRPRRK